MEGRSLGGNGWPIFLESIHPHLVTASNLLQIEALGAVGLVESLSTTGVSGSRELVDI